MSSLKLTFAFVIVVILSCGAIFLAGCGGSDDGGGAANGTAAVGGDSGGGAAKKAIDAATAATITGTIKWEGDVPVRRTIDTEADTACHTMHQDEPLQGDKTIVNDNGTLRDVVVTIKKSGLKGWKIPGPPSDPVVVDQIGCRYVPHTFAIQVGQPIKITNSDQTKHNVHFIGMLNSEFNESQNPGQDIDLPNAFKQAEGGKSCYLKCEIHSWMKANVHIFDHPFFDVTGEDGTFTISGLPPGDYTVEVRHQRYKSAPRKVTLGASETKSLDFTFKK